MPAINDYKCIQCNLVHTDLLYEPTSCYSCGAHAFEVFFGNWSTIEFDARKGERLDAHGAVRQFGVLDDPLARSQLGLTSDPQLASYARVPAEQAEELRGRLMKDGDSGKLRKDVLEAYSKATGKYEVQRD